jgi:serine/threonine protein kinase
MALEVMVSGDYGTPADVYSYGMVIYEIVTGYSPFVHLKTVDEVKNAVLKKKERPTLPPPRLPIYELIELCWKQAPEERPEIDEVMLMMMTETVALPGTEMERVFAYLGEIEYHPTNKPLYR